MDEPEKIKVKSVSALGGAASLDKLAFNIILLAIFLAPIFFIPSILAPFLLTKILAVFILTSIGSVLFICARLKEGNINVPSVPFFVAGLVLLIAQFLSTIFSANSTYSLFGQAFEPLTFGALFFMFVLMFLTMSLFKSGERIFYAFVALLGSLVLVFLFQTVRIFWPSLMTFGGIFADSSASIVGSWNDLGILFGLSVLLTLLISELLTINRLFRAIIYGGLLLSLLFMAVVNFVGVWWTVGVVSLVFFTYLATVKYARVVPNISQGETGADARPKVLGRKISYLSLAVVIVSAVFIVDRYLPGLPVSSAISRVTNISQVDVRPSWLSTLQIAKATLAKDPIFGVGPNLFSIEWLMYKPLVVNNTIFWNTNFNSGVGFIPSSLITSGILGFASWLLFLAIFLILGFRALFQTVSDPFSRFVTITSFLCSVFLWIFSVIYNPGFVITALTFVFSGLFIASLSSLGGFRAGEFTFAFSGNPRKGFVAVLFLIVIMIGIVTMGVVLADKYVSFVDFQRANYVYNTKGDTASADQLLHKAVSLNDIDLFNRFLAQLSLIKVNNLLVSAKDSPTDKTRSDFQTFLGDAIRYAKKSTDQNPTDYQNWMVYAGVYDAIVPLKISGAYENALSKYKEAQARNPFSPAIDLAIARLNISNGNVAGAKESIKTALNKKNDYTDAIFLSSQIEAGEGNLTSAALSAEKASQLAPNDPTVFFQLGLLRYNLKDYTKAVGALERSIALAPNYANAKYFLGLSYNALGKRSDAIKQFTDIEALNPDNSEVALILGNLKAGREPFANAKPPVDNKPEKRSTPPLQDKTSADKGGLTE